MIGAKTIMSALLLVVVTALAIALGANPARLATLGAIEAFAVGVFAFLAGGLAHRYFRLHLKSAHYLRQAYDDTPWGDEAHFLGNARRRILVGENTTGEAYDFSPRTHYAIYVALALWTALLTLDSRAVTLLRDLPEKLAEGGSEYCREPAPLAAESEAPKEEPGCALIKRAYALGFTKSLGPCGAKPEETRHLQICTLRQKDEPILHYALRRLALFESGVKSQTSSAHRAASKADFETRLDHLPELYAANRFTVASSPRASHHIFTNLPNPGGWLAEANGAVLESKECAERYRRLPPRIDTLSPSAQLEHVVAQLLFDTRYARAVGSCREMTIHWGAPADACEQLVKSPSELLSSTGALGPVRTILERYRVTTELQEVLPAAQGMSKLGSILKSVTPSRFVSFSCYIEEERSDVVTSSREITLDGQPFPANEVRVPITQSEHGVDDRYHHVASMLVPSFHYGTLLSDASADNVLAEGVDAKYFTGPYGFFSRLEYLNDVDIFLGSDWIQDRSDLMEIYPFHVHLGNYVALFRSRYRAERGRL